MSIITISSPSFAENGKSGVMVPDETGYYDVSMGGLNTFNSKGEFYLAYQVEELFGNYSKLSERAKRRELFAEDGHPTPRPGETQSAFISRAMGINEANTCSHIREISLDLEFGKKNPSKTNKEAIAIYGKIIPAGAKAAVVERAIANKYEQLAYSIRCIAEKAIHEGKTVKRVIVPITFDRVNSPGIGYATKDNSLSLESDGSAEHAMRDYLVDVDIMKNVLEEGMSYMSNESAGYQFREEVLRAISKTKEIKRKNRTIFMW